MRQDRFPVLALGLASCMALSTPGCRREGAPEPARTSTPLPNGTPGHGPRLYRDATSELGLKFVHSQSLDGRVDFLPQTLGPGVASLDYDGDGFEDIFLVQGTGSTRDGDPAARPASHLYRNGGGRALEEVGRESGADLRSWGQACLAFDHGNDGYPDLLITCYRERPRLLRNMGDGTFAEVGSLLGLPPGDRWWSFATAIEHDRSGRLGLYLGAYARFGPKDWAQTPRMIDYGTGAYPSTMIPQPYRPEPNAFLRSRADGTYEDATGPMGLADGGGRGLGALAADLDGNGWTDLFVANDVSPCALFTNDHGVFTNVARRAWVDESRGSMGLALGDIDRDHFFDLVCTHWVGDVPAVYKSLQRRTGRMCFKDEAETTGVARLPRDLVGWAVSFVDLANAGREDLVIVHGHTNHDPRTPGALTPQPTLILLDRGDGTFAMRPPESRAPEAPDRPRVGRGAAFTDLDNDGYVDVVVGANNGPAEAWVHVGGRSSWLGLVLAGVRSNREGVGARLTLSADGAGRVKQVTAGESFFSSNSRRCLFGLGTVEAPCRVTVGWPSGATEVFEGLATRRYHRLVEGSGTFRAPSMGWYNEKGPPDRSSRGTSPRAHP